MKVIPKSLCCKVVLIGFPLTVKTEVSGLSGDFGTKRILKNFATLNRRFVKLLQSAALLKFISICFGS